MCALLLLAMVPQLSFGQPFDHTVTIQAPAVAMQNGEYVGTVSDMVVGISEGDGSIYVETWPLSEIDTQASARLAVSVAGELTGMDVQSHNFYYSIVSEAPVIGGPSAGGILTVATIACLNGWELDQDVMMTGMINPDGSIGPVGGIYEKAKAAHEYGITTFLVPEGQATVQRDGETIDLSQYAPREWGMEVKEVFDIEDAVAEFTGYTYEKEEFEGDLEVDQHHLVEDVGIALGKAFDTALGDRRGINRTGYFVFPMDESLAVVAVDIGGRPTLQYDAPFSRRYIGELDGDLLYDLFKGFADNLRATVAVRVIQGRNDHHKAEAIFKALGKAMRMACSHDPRLIEDIPSTKGVIE